jgi:hypothetical protein
MMREKLDAEIITHNPIHKEERKKQSRVPGSEHTRWWSDVV